MNETKYTAFFTPEEIELKGTLEAQLRELSGDALREDDFSRIESLLAEAIEAERIGRHLWAKPHHQQSSDSHHRG